MSIKPDINTNTYTILVNREPSPNKYSTKLKLNSPTRPQFIHPIMLNTNELLNNVFINFLLDNNIFTKNYIIIHHITKKIPYNLP